MSITTDSLPTKMGGAPFANPHGVCTKVFIDRKNNVLHSEFSWYISEATKLAGNDPISNFKFIVAGADFFDNFPEGVENVESILETLLVAAIDAKNPRQRIDWNGSIEMAPETVTIVTP